MSQEQAPPERDEAAAEFRANERSWNAEVIGEFRANGGEVAAPYDDPPPMLLIHTIGARSGKEHIVPMRSLPDGESLYVFASAHGSDRQPDWYYNLVANPDVTIEKGTEILNDRRPGEAGQRGGNTDSRSQRASAVISQTTVPTVGQAALPSYPETHDRAEPEPFPRPRAWNRPTEGQQVDDGEASESRATSMRLFLFVLAVAVFNGVLTGSMINVVLPLIRADFAASPAQAGWIITGFALAYAIGIPIYGRISSVYGVRRLFALGLVGFAAGGLICALAPNLPILVLGRAMQGLTGAAVPALATVAIATVLPPGARGGALGLIVSSVGVGQVVGPIVGGGVGQVADWRVLFIGTLLLALLIIPGVWRVLPDGGSGGERGFDFAGGALLGLAAGLVLFGVTQGQAAGFGSITSWGSVLGGVVAAAGFAWRITHVADPFVSPRLFRNRAYVAAGLVAFFTMFAYLSSIVMVPLLLIEVNGLTPANAGLVLTPGAVAVAILSPISGRLSDRIGIRIPVLVGLTVMGLSIFFLSAFAVGASPLLMAVGMLGIGVGFALESSPLSNAAANALPAAQIGEGMGLYQAFFFLGGGIGAALTAALLAARREGSSDAFNPFYSLDAAPFSDVFLALAVIVVAALLAAIGLRSRDAETDAQVRAS